MSYDSLKGKTIYIGRESGSGRLLAYLQTNGNTVGFPTGNPGSVPNSVSRANPAQGKAHLSIKIDTNGNITVTNLKQENVTFVNSSQIVSKRVSETDTIELGSERYPLQLANILQSVASRLHGSPNPGPQQPQTFNISHLEEVWNDYHEGDLAIKDKQHKMGLQQRIPIFFTIGAGALTTVAWSLGWGEWIKIVSICLTGTGLLLMIYFFLQASKFNPAREADKIREKFQNEYKCPNPNCRRFLGFYSYSMLKNQYHNECPFCRSKFEE